MRHYKNKTDRQTHRPLLDETLQDEDRQTEGQSETDRQNDTDKDRPLLDETSYDTECVMDGPFGFLQYEFVGAVHQD